MTTRTTARTLSVLAAVGLLAVAGCAEDPVVDADAAPSIHVRIADGKISPLGLETDATVGETIHLSVSADTDDELHLHADPEKSFDITPGNHTFTFEVDVPGSVSLESHHVGGTIATIDVRP